MNNRSKNRCRKKCTGQPSHLPEKDIRIGGFSGGRQLDRDDRMEVTQHMERNMLTTTLQTIWNLLPKDEDGKVKNEVPKFYEDGLEGVTTLYWNGLLEGLGKTGPDDEPVTLLRILERCGMQCAINTTAFPGHSRPLRLYACYCVRVRLNWQDETYEWDEKDKKESEPYLLAIEAVEKYTRGKGSADAMADALFRAEEYLKEQGYCGNGLLDLARLVATRGDDPSFGDMLPKAYYKAMESLNAPDFNGFYRKNEWYLPIDAAWNLANEAAAAKLREDMFQTVLQKANHGLEDLRREFIRLCKLEGEYGEVDTLDNPW